MVSFSIIVCSYNPDQKIFSRLLNAISEFHSSSPDHEVILIDNNSDISLNSIGFVIDFINSGHNRKLIVEKEPGLTNARIAGIKAAQHDWLIFFDDDNEPDSNYLIAAKKVIQDYPEVGVWGPGEVNVIYTDEINIWLQQNKSFFQQRNEVGVSYSYNIHWHANFPNGTGMIVNKAIAEEYVARVLNKRYTISDRSGRSLSSGGDLQIVLTGLQLGYATGVASELSLKHLIDNKKTDFKYLRKLIYGTTSSYIKSYNQVFENKPLIPSAPSNLLIIKLFWYYYKQIRKHKDVKKSVLSLTRQLGEVNAGLFYDSSLRKPFFLKLFELIFL